MDGLKTFAKRARAALITARKPWYAPAQNTPSEIRTVRRFAIRAMLQRWPWWFRPLFAAAMAAGAAWNALHSSHRLLAGQALPDRAPGVFGRLAWRSWRYNHPPFQTWAFGLLTGPPEKADLILSPEEAALCNRAICDRDTALLLGNKDAFARFCEDHSVRVPKTRAIFQNGEALQAFEDGAPPARDLFVKPVDASSGQYATLWMFDGDYRAMAPQITEPGTRLDAQAFVEFLRTLSKDLGATLLVQDAISAHPVFCTPEDTGPPMVRLSSARWPDDRIEVLTALLQVARPGSSVSQGGPLRMVDAATGVVEAVLNPADTAARLLQADDPALDHLSLPDWDEAVAAVTKLHRGLAAPVPFVFWDLVFSPAGPVVLEGNVRSGPLFEQAITKRPAADGAWHRVLAEYLP
ncbi:MAG: sugar-transfer associated ATP-grasp domain-containing protein [Pseudomonadota bacterium]